MKTTLKRKPKHTRLVALIMGVLAYASLMAAEKVSAGFTLCTGISHEVGVAETFLSRYRTSLDSSAMEEFSSEKRPSFILVIQ
ncbi:MAG: hypothetical protein IJG13_20650 [Kiritimatiellae bacterium]|nr:hypothetical protein [Kiritimatiellia bacterium]